MLRNLGTMQDVAQIREALERHGVALEKWLIRLPNGAEWPVVKVPRAAECNVCNTLAPIPAAAGRVDCGACGAHVLTVSAR